MPEQPPVIYEQISPVKAAEVIVVMNEPSESVVSAGVEALKAETVDQAC